jgi:spectinomycin phosphotransferase
MLTPPDLSTDSIIAFVRASYGLRIRQVAFLPIGADIDAAVYRLEAEDNSAYFLKLKRGNFAEIAVALPALLNARGIRHVMAPIATAASQMWASEQGFTWILYPFFNGRQAAVSPLTDAQWVALGQSLKAVHSTVLPPALGELVPREDYSSRWRDMVRAFDHEIETCTYADPIARDMAAFWRTKRDEIRVMVARAVWLGQVLRERPTDIVLCHTDLHPWNVLVGADGAMAIVDWDAPLFATKERDLMFLEGGFSEDWDDAHNAVLFYEGYGPAKIDLVALAYYRYERIVDDLAAYGKQILGVQGSEEDRAKGLRQVMEAFMPSQVVEFAHRTYRRLP